jgi:hypothetical protein
VLPDLPGRYSETTLLLQSANGHAQHVRIGSVYAPTKPTNKPSFFNTLRQQLTHTTTPLVLGGDFNLKITASDTARDYEGGRDCTALATFISEAPIPLHDVIHITNPSYCVHDTPTFTALGYHAHIDHLLATFNGSFSKVTVHSLHRLSANHAPILAHLDLAHFNANHHPFRLTCPLPLLHVDTTDSTQAALFKTKCKEWEANLPAHIASLFLTTTNNYDNQHLSDQHAAVLEEALASLTELATTTAAEVYPTHVQHQHAKFQWRSPFKHDQPAGTLLHQAMWARRAI